MQAEQGRCASGPAGGKAAYRGNRQGAHCQLGEPHLRLQHCAGVAQSAEAALLTLLLLALLQLGAAAQVSHEQPCVGRTSVRPGVTAPCPTSNYMLELTEQGHRMRTIFRTTGRQCCRASLTD